MAAKGIVNSHQADVEYVVNRWLVDYYMFLAVELFQKEQYADFCGIRDVLDSVLARPMESTDTMPTKINVLHFLSRINEGECIDVSFESDQSISPLESALMLMGKIRQECNVPPQDFENVCTSLKEMIVGIFIKNNEFAKAKQALNKHFPKQMVGKKAIFMGLISQKSKTHKVIEQMDFKRFREEMLAFCQRLCPFNVPFLYKAAKQLVDKRHAEQCDKTAGPSEEDQPSPFSAPQISTIHFVPCIHTIIQKTRLEVAYKALAAGSDEITFAQLEEEVEGEEQVRRKDLSLRLTPTPKTGASRDSEQDELFQRDSGSPMEASPAEQPPQTDAVPQTQACSLSKTPSVLRNSRLYTVARLVVEPDSQASSQCRSASQDLETDVRTEEPPQSPAIPNENDPQSPRTDNEVTTPKQKRLTRATKICSRASTSSAELTGDREEEPSGSVANCAGKLHNRSNSSLSRNSTKSKQSSSDSEKDQQESQAFCKTPVRKPRKLASDPFSEDPDNTGDIRIADFSLDSSPNMLPPLNPVPQTSSTPHKDSAQDKSPSHSKWEHLYKNAKESKDTWSDEESYFSSRKRSHNISSRSNESTISNSGHKKKQRWTESETQKLKEGVSKFGEGNWSKILAYYSIKGRTNVNLKDRWRTLKKLKMV